MVLTLRACGAPMLIAVACASSETPETTVTGSPAGRPEIVSADLTVPQTAVILARELTVVTDQPTTLTVRLRTAEGDEELAHTYPAVASRHVVPVLGFTFEQTYDVVVEVTNDAGDVATTVAATVETQAPPDLWPEWEVLSSDPEAMEPGFTLFSIRTPNRSSEYYIAVDAGGRPRWGMLLDGGTSVTTTDLSWRDGTLLGLQGGAVVRYDILGRELSRHAAEGADGFGLVPDAERFHHEVDQTADGTVYTMASQPLLVPDYPVAINQLDAYAPATIEDNLVVELDDSGDVTYALSLADVLDERRVGFSSFDIQEGGVYDWAHANSVQYIPEDDSYIVSVRHQDAVVKVGRDGDLRWILGDPAGWGPEHAPYLLTPLPNSDGTPFLWPYYQHAADGVMAPGGGMNVLMFDNHNNGTTVYSGEDPNGEAKSTSRLVEYHVDEVAMTVQQIWEYKETAVGRVFSSGMGDADRMATTDNVLGVWGRASYTDGTRNTNLGIGLQDVRIIEVTRDPTPVEVFHLHLSSDLSQLDLGWTANRAERVESLLPLE